MLNWYEMLKRPVSIGCQPKGFIDTDHSKGSWGIVAYERKLTKEELEEFEMKPWAEEYSDTEMAKILVDMGYNVDLDIDHKSFNSFLVAELAINEGYRWNDYKEKWSNY